MELAALVKYLNSKDSDCWAKAMAWGAGNWSEVFANNIQ